MYVLIGVSVFVLVLSWYLNLVSLKLKTFKSQPICLSNSEPTKSQQATSWNIDEKFDERNKQIGCDLKVFNFNETAAITLLRSLQYKNAKPFIIRGYTSSWPAAKKWTRQNFSHHYGQRLVKTGSESSIVYGGGIAGITISVDEMLADLRKPSFTDHFTFDVSILKSIPELRRDYSTPTEFKSWDNPNREQQGHVWCILSLGASRSGLPFHVHGETWLGLVFGKKRWFLYPPGFSQPEKTYGEFVPIRRVLDWLEKVYPSLLALPKPPAAFLDFSQPNPAGSTSDNEMTGYRPFECIQLPGDVVYVPPGWGHQTINIGEAIALGRQSVLGAGERLQLSTDVLASFPRNFDALKGAALSLAHMAADIENVVKSKLRETKDGVVQLREDNFEAMIFNSEDTWLVYFNEKPEGNRPSASQKKFDRVWSSVASKLKGLVSVGMVELSEVSRVKFSALCRCELHSTLPSDVSVTSDFHPIVYLYPGGSSSEIVGYPDVANKTATAISDFALDVLMDPSRNLNHGSATTLGAKARTLFQRSVNYLRIATEINPMHPEVRGLLGEVLGYLGDKNAMVDSIADAVQLYDSADLEGVSNYSLSSVYHKLGTTFLTVGRATSHYLIKYSNDVSLQKEYSDLAIPLLQKSLQISPDYVPALVDIAVSYVLNKDFSSAENALQELSKVSPTHSAIKYINSQIAKGRKLLEENSIVRS